MSHRIWASMLVVLSVAFLAASAWTRLDEPAAQDELCELGAADTLYEEGVARDIYNDFAPVAYSPHLNLLAIRASYHALGPGIVAARLPGVVFAIATLLLIYCIVVRRGEGDAGRRRVIAGGVVALCASLPVFVQASALIHIDNALLTFLILALVHAVDRHAERPSVGRAFMVVLVFAIALWARITTPVFLAPILWVLAFGSPERRVRWQLPGLFLTGAGLFVGTWWLYCYFTPTPFAQPFTYTWEAFVNRAGVEESRLTVSAIARNVAQLTLWVGLFAMALFALFSVRRAFDFLNRRRLEREDIYLVCGFAILLGYTVVGGTPFGFPKYHCPAFPLFAAAIGIAGCRETWERVRVRPSVLAGAFVAAFLVQWILCGDPIQVVRFDLREAQAGLGERSPAGVTHALLVAVGTSIAAWGTIFILMLTSGFRRRVTFAALPVVIGAGVGLVTLQNLSAGGTGYSYGSAEAQTLAREIDAIIEAAPAPATAIAPSEILYLIRERGLEYVPNELWSDRALLRDRLADPANRVYAVGIATNTVGQVVIPFEDEAIRALLEDEYEARQVGTFHLWWRPGPTSE